MKKVLIIDDEPLARRIVKEYLKDRPDFELVGECGDGFEALKLIQELQPDLLFLDIQMPKITGFELLEVLTDRPLVIFTTAYDEYALKAFDLSAIDYLLKPFSKDRFDIALQKLDKSEHQQQKVDELLEKQEFHTEASNRVVIKDGGSIKIIPLDDIDYFEAYDDYVKIHVDGKVHVKKQTMNHYEKSLKNKQFVRIHRSYIINIHRLTKIESFEKNSYIAILNTGVRLPISRNYYSTLKTILGV